MRRRVTFHSLQRLRERLPPGPLIKMNAFELQIWVNEQIDLAIDRGDTHAVLDNNVPTDIVRFTIGHEPVYALVRNCEERADRRVVVTVLDQRMHDRNRDCRWQELA